MTFVELLKSIDVEDVIAALSELPAEDFSSSELSYRQMLDRLKNIEPTLSAERYVFHVARSNTAQSYADDLADQDDQEWLDVYGIKEGSTDHCAMELTPWTELLSMEVVDETGALSPAKVVAAIVWEITFFGFTEDEIQKFRGELNRLQEELEETLKTLPEDPTDADYEDRGLRVWKPSSWLEEEKES